MRRRQFLNLTGSVCLLPFAGCRHDYQSSARSPKLGAWRHLIARLESQIPTEMQKAALPGLSIALIRNGNIFWRRGFGVKDAHTKARVDNGTVFQAASMSKPVFAYAVMKLCEKGILGLDVPLSRYTPERFVENDQQLELITARHVLSHTTGLPNWRSSKSPLRIEFPPGTRYRYSGEGYFYLQSVITHLTGNVNPDDCATFESDLKVCATDIEAFLKANVLLPFGMTLSGYTWNDTLSSQIARGHDAAGAPFDSKRPRLPSIARYGSSGALLTTPTDYARFLIEVIDSKSSDAFRLNSASLHEMVRPHVKVNEFTSWALGWAVYNAQQRPFIGHGGDNKGFHSFAVASVPDKTGYVIMTNGDSGINVLKNIMERINTFLAGEA